MCDCYDHQCERCSVTVPIHIGDFAFEREAVEVWCHHHVRPGKGMEVFELTQNEFYCHEYHFKKGDQFGIRLKGGELRPSHHDVTPNLCNDIVVSWDGEDAD